MPRISDQFLDCSVYLYRSEQNARDGEQSGGSGFLVHVPSERHQELVYLYAVTNRHLVDNGCRFLRLNTEEGRLHIVRSEPEEWRFHPELDDVAVLPLDLDLTALRWFSVGSDKFISREIMTEYRVGPGDEVFLIGRLVTVEGRQRNTPVARFGNLSMTAHADEPITREDGVEQESFIVECRSLSGFSGSPVFVTTTQRYETGQLPRVLQTGEPVPTPEPEAGGIRATLVGLGGTNGPWLLGIDWGHVPLWRPVYERDRHANERHATENYVVDANTGMAYVVPAWRILELLNERDLLNERRREDEQIARRNCGQVAN